MEVLQLTTTIDESGYLHLSIPTPEALAFSLRIIKIVFVLNAINR